MISLKEIEQNYPENLRGFKKNLLREYLQYRILEIIFNSKLSYKLSFIGGTALRIIYGNSRFSEDLDFDNFNLTKKDFSLLVEKIEKELQKEGYLIESRIVFKDAYRCYIKISQILFDNKISNLKGEKILVQVDTAPHNFDYKPDKKILNKFEIFSQINVTPIDILLSQKIYAILNRKRGKGRDYFDVIFLLQKTKPNYKYLKEKKSINNKKELKKSLVSNLKNVNLNLLANDVKPFLFNPSDVKKIKLFGEYIKQIEL